MSCLLCTQSCSDVYVCLVYNVKVQSVKFYLLINLPLLISRVVYLVILLRQFLLFGFWGLKFLLMGIYLVGKKTILRLRGHCGHVYKTQVLVVTPGLLLKHTKYFYNLQYYLVLKFGVFWNSLLSYRDVNPLILMKRCYLSLTFLNPFLDYIVVHLMLLFISCLIFLPCFPLVLNKLRPYWP